MFYFVKTLQDQTFTQQIVDPDFYHLSICKTLKKCSKTLFKNLLFKKMESRINKNVKICLSVVVYPWQNVDFKNLKMVPSALLNIRLLK